MSSAGSTDTTLLCAAHQSEFVLGNRVTEPWYCSQQLVNLLLSNIALLLLGLWAILYSFYLASFTRAAGCIFVRL